MPWKNEEFYVQIRQTVANGHKHKERRKPETGNIAVPSVVTMAATATSLEILEECFERIYTTRKNVLASKHRSFMRTEDKRKRGKLTTPVRQQRGGGSPTRGGGVGVRGNLGDMLTRLQESDDDNDEVGNSHHHLTPPPPKRGTGGAKSSTVAPKVIGSHQELNPNDLTATVVFDEFRTELMAWVTERLHAFQSPAHAGKAPQAARKEYLEVRCRLLF